MEANEKLSLVWYPRKAALEQKMQEVLLDLEYAESNWIAPVEENMDPDPEAEYTRLQLYYVYLEGSLNNVNTKIDQLEA